MSIEGIASSGHEFWVPGVYLTRRFETAREYARPHQLFGDGTFYRCVVKVRYDPQEVRKQRSKGGDQVVVPSCAVVIEGVFFGVNDPPTKGEERFEDWQDAPRPSRDLEFSFEGLLNDGALGIRETLCVPIETERVSAAVDTAARLRGHRLVPTAAVEVAKPAEAPLAGEAMEVVDTEATPLFWRVLKVLSQRGVLPSNFLPAHLHAYLHVKKHFQRRGADALRPFAFEGIRPHFEPSRAPRKAFAGAIRLGHFYVVVDKAAERFLREEAVHGAVRAAGQ
eukprot:s802_g9.t1